MRRRRVFLHVAGYPGVVWFGGPYGSYLPPTVALPDNDEDDDEEEEDGDEGDYGDYGTSDGGVMAGNIHVHVHDGGTSEGAKKGWLKRARGALRRAGGAVKGYAERVRSDLEKEKATNQRFSRAPASGSPALEEWAKRSSGPEGREALKRYLRSRKKRAAR